jgi:thiol-disulfide isomerase/thioredoxin|uniref:TlpA family protein disulfide reductase n=1 Tax=Orrella sp. TaxID=1921583 RepID=UPI004048A8FA
MKRRTAIIGALGLAAMGSVGYFGWQQSSRRAPQANRAIRSETATSPGIESFFATALPNMAGEEQRMAQWRGRALVINFWATWCPPCVKEMPDLNRLAQQHPGAQFLGIAIDTASNVTEFVKKVPVSYPIFVAGYGGLGLVRALGNVAGGLPFTVLVRAQGDLGPVILGPVDPDSLGAQVAQLVSGSTI